MFPRTALPVSPHIRLSVNPRLVLFADPRGHDGFDEESQDSVVFSLLTPTVHEARIQLVEVQRVAIDLARIFLGSLLCFLKLLFENSIAVLH